MIRLIIIWMMIFGLIGEVRAQIYKKTVVDSAAAAAAVKSFMTASGGSGMWYQYQTRYDVVIRGTEQVMVDTMSSALAENGCKHVDMGTSGMRVFLLGRVGLPIYSVTVNPQTKTYRLNIIDTARVNNENGQTFQVTKVGTETMAGYACTHAKMTVIGKDKKIVMTDDVWTSTAVPTDAQLRQQIANEHLTIKMMQELEKAGCGGFLVKMTGATPTTGNASQTKFEMTLITVARKNFLASEFEIPAGYTESGGLQKSR